MQASRCNGVECLNKIVKIENIKVMDYYTVSIILPDTFGLTFLIAIFGNICKTLAKKLIKIIKCRNCFKNYYLPKIK